MKLDDKVVVAMNGINFYINSFNVFTTVSISSLVLYLLKEKRIAILSGLLSIASITWLPILVPLVQALPPEAQI